MWPWRSSIGLVAPTLLITGLIVSACDGSSDESTSTSGDAAASTTAVETSTGQTTSPGTAGDGEGAPPTPAAAEARTTLAFLHGDGSPVLAMHRIAIEWNSDATAAECEATGDTLDREVPTDMLGVMIAEVADEPLQALLDAEAIALNAAVAACLAGSTVPSGDDVAPLSEIAPAVQDRLDELESSRGAQG